MKNLDRAIRVYMALNESDAIVSSATLWDWNDLQSALSHNPSLLNEMKSLDKKVRGRTLRYVECFEPFSVDGSTYVFEGVDDAESYANQMEQSGAVVERLSGRIVRVVSSDDALAETVAADFGATRWEGPNLSESFDYVDIALPEDMLRAGLRPIEVQEALLKSLWDRRPPIINESVFLHSDKPIDRFKNRLSNFAVASNVHGVDPFIFEGLRRSGMLDPRVCLLLEQEPVAAGGVATAEQGNDQSRGGISKDQPNAQTGPPAQSQTEPQDKNPLPTEHVPTREEGGEGMGGVKMPDGTTIPEQTMRSALSKLLKNLATQIESGTEGGTPDPRTATPAAPQQPKEQPEPEGGPGQQNNDTQPAEAPQPTVNQQSPNPAIPAAPGFAEGIENRPTLYKALGNLRTSDAGKIIRGLDEVVEIGFAGQSQSVVEKILDEMDRLSESESSVIRAMVTKTLSADLYRDNRSIVLGESISYGSGSAEAGTPVSIIEDKGNYQLVQLPDGDVVKVRNAALSLITEERAMRSGAVAVSTIGERRPDLARSKAAKKGHKGKTKDFYRKRTTASNKTRKKPMDQGRKDRNKASRKRRKTLTNSSRASMDEQLDVGQDDEKMSGAKGLGKMGKTLKACREHAFQMVTADLPQIMSMAEAVKAKKSLKALGKLQEKLKGLMDQFGEAADLLNKANEIYKGESGGVGGDNVEQQQQMATGGAVAPVAGQAVPGMAPAPAQAPAVAEAIRKISNSSLVEQIAEGGDYRYIIEQMGLEVAGLGLSRLQLHEVYDRLSSVAYMQNLSRDYEFSLSHKDHKILSSSRSVDPLVEGLLARTENCTSAFVSMCEVEAALKALRSAGRSEHLLLAESLQNSMS